MTINDRYRTLIQSDLFLSTFKVEFSPAIERKQYLNYLKAFESISMFQAVQSFALRYVLNSTHLKSAVWHAVSAKQANRMISKSLSLEILLYLSCQRQIYRAIEYLGLEEQITSAGIIVVMQTVNLEEKNRSKMIEENFIKVWKTVFKDYTFTLLPYTPTFNAVHIKDILNLFEIPFTMEDSSEKKIENFILSKIALLSFQ